MPTYEDILPILRMVSEEEEFDYISGSVVPLEFKGSITRSLKPWHFMFDIDEVNYNMGTPLITEEEEEDA